MKTYDLVIKLLREQPELRSSDKLLQWEVFKLQGIVEDGFISRNNFLFKALSTETVRRTRQKIQELHPELSASQSVKTLRDEKQKSKGTWIFRDNTCYYKPDSEVAI